MAELALWAGQWGKKVFCDLNDKSFNYFKNPPVYRMIPEMAEKKNCLPIFIDATAEHSIPNLLWGGQTGGLALSNNHLSYIITW